MIFPGSARSSLKSPVCAWGRHADAFPSRYMGRLKGTGRDQRDRAGRALLDLVGPADKVSSTAIHTNCPGGQRPAAQEIARRLGAGGRISYRRRTKIVSGLDVSTARRKYPCWLPQGVARRRRLGPHLGCFISHDLSVVPRAVRTTPVGDFCTTARRSSNTGPVRPGIFASAPGMAYTQAIASPRFPLPGPSEPGLAGRLPARLSPPHQQGSAA